MLAGDLTEPAVEPCSEPKLFENSGEAKTTSKTQVCRFHLIGRCTYGNNCKFLHQSSKTKESTFDGAPRSVCWYYLNSWCRYGARCGYLHSRPRKPLPAGMKSAGDRTLSAGQTGRDSEIIQFKKRFPMFTQEEEWFGFSFVPSDPDWPYEVRQINLMVSFPENYPSDPVCLKLGENQRLPETVRRQLEMRIQELLASEHQKFVESNSASSFFRAFLKKLDKDMENMFTGSLKVYQREVLAKAAGLEFIPHFSLPGANARMQEGVVTPAGSGTEAHPTEHEHGNTQAVLGHIDSEEQERIQGNEHAKTVIAASNNPEQRDWTEEDVELDTDKAADLPQGDNRLASAGQQLMRHGTEVRLRGLQLLGAAATLQCTKLALIVACGRCRYRDALPVTAAATSATECTRCHEQQSVAYTPVLAHAFSVTLGYLKPSGCTPFDVALVDCLLTAGCLNCGKDCKLQGLQPGQINKQWCLHCHQKMEIAADKVSFITLQPAQPTITGHENVEKITRIVRRKAKDPAIREGEPLPDEGTCGHFKKSYRWFRFPCCGKLYPCDKCHNLQETDHEMQYANRMVCGFCSKEQPFSADRPCISCSSALNRPKTAHWEGGKGCREKIHMDRHESKKYANTNKTIPKKVTSAKQSSAKNSVVRHAT